MDLLTSRWVWKRGMLSSPLQAEDRREQKLSFVLRTRVGEWGSEPNRPKCKRWSYSFLTRILTKLFRTQRGSFLLCNTKRVACIVVLQKLGKALVHSGDVTMNLCFFKEGKRWLYSSHGFLKGSCGSSGKVLGYGLDGLHSIPGVGGVEIFFTPSFPDCFWSSLSLL